MPNKKVFMKPLSEWLVEYGDPAIEVDLSGNKGVDFLAFVESPEFKEVISEACKWVQYYFMFHLEKSKPMISSGGTVKIESVFQHCEEL